VLKVFPI